MSWKGYLLYRFREIDYYVVEAAKGTNLRFLWLTVLIYSIAGILMAWMFAIAIGSMRRPRDPLPNEGELPILSVIVPCYNEEIVIRRSVAAVTSLDYPSDRIQILYVFDRGGDRTPEVLEELARDHPIEVVENRSDDHTKAGAINHVLARRVKGEVVAIYDADTCPHPGNARRAVAWLSADPALGLVNGRRRILNSRENVLTRIVSLEYHALYRVEHYGRPSIGGISLFYGSNGFFRRAALEALNGFDSRMLVEDIDVGFRLLENGYEARYDPYLEEFDEAPPTLRAWWRQRLRWGRGWIQVVGRHKCLVKRLPGFQRSSATFMLATVPAPLVILPLWLMLVPFLLDPVNRVAFFRPGFWLVAWSAPIAYFMVGWFHDARKGERRWGDLPLTLAVVPMVAYYTLRSLVMWHAFFQHFTRRRVVWVKTDRSVRAAGLSPVPPLVAASTAAPSAPDAPPDREEGDDGPHRGDRGPLPH